MQENYKAFYSQDGKDYEANVALSKTNICKNLKRLIPWPNRSRALQTIATASRR